MNLRKKRFAICWVKKDVCKIILINQCNHCGLMSFAANFGISMVLYTSCYINFLNENIRRFTILQIE